MIKYWNLITDLWYILDKYLSNKICIIYFLFYICYVFNVLPFFTTSISSSNCISNIPSYLYILFAVPSFPFKTKIILFISLDIIIEMLSFVYPKFLLYIFYFFSLSYLSYKLLSILSLSSYLFYFPFLKEV